MKTKLHLEHDAPEWMTEAGIITLREGYLLPGETVKGMFTRISSAAAKRLNMPELEEQFFWAINSGYFCLASPILSNMGTDRGYPISCFGQTIGDSILDIFEGQTEFAMLAKNGGGVSQNMSNIRAEGSPIKGGVNGLSQGSVPFAHCFDSAVLAVSQGSVRRGANAFWWPATHGDRKAALKIRRPLGAESLQCLNSNHGFVFDDATMQSIVDGSNRENREFWAETIKTRVETGEPYIMYLENSNKFPSERLHRIYKKFNLKNTYSNICSEILLPGDVDHTFVCCISSLPIHRFKEWRDLGVVRLMVFFLDAVLDEFIDRAKDVRGLEKAVRFAKKSRAIGIGVLGYHTFLQNENLPFGSLPARSWNKVIFRHIKEEAEKASQELAKLRGEPEWCQGEGFRNTHLMAIAPTATNSVISGHVSPGIEPWPSAFFNHKTAKATFTLQNPTLLKVLEEKGKNTPEVWKEIRAANGSVQTLEFLSDHEKEVFLTAGEMDMRDVVDAAADRQAFIDQGQSLNLFFYPPQKSGGGDDSEFAGKVKTFYKYVNETHIRAWKAGVKTIYYCRSKGVVSADTAARGHDRKTIDGAAAKSPTNETAKSEVAVATQESHKTESDKAGTSLAVAAVPEIVKPELLKQEPQKPVESAPELAALEDIEPIDASYDECKFCT